MVRRNEKYWKRMRKLLPILSLVLLTACGPSQEEKEKVAAVTCSIMSETRNMDSAVRVRELNEARGKIGGEPFLRGDDVIQEAIKWGLCQELVLNEPYEERLQSLKDAKRERERIAAEKRAEEQRIAAEKRAEEQRIAAEKQRIADSKPTIKEEFHSNGKLKSRINYQSKTDGGKQHGLYEYYRENGRLHQKGNFKNGKQDGLWETYWKNGQLKWKGNYKDGEKDGLYEDYHNNGQLSMRGNFKDGKPDGLFDYYHENGDPFFACFKNDEEVDMSNCED